MKDSLEKPFQVTVKKIWDDQTKIGISEKQSIQFCYQIKEKYKIYQAEFKRKFHQKPKINRNLTCKIRFFIKEENCTYRNKFV